MHTAYLISFYVQMAGSVAIAISCLLYFNYRKPFIRILGYYALASVLFSLAQQVSVFFFANEGIVPIGNMSVISEAVFFSCVFYFVTQNPKFRRGIILSSFIYGFFCLVTLLFFEDRLSSFIRSGRDFLLIIYAVAYFYYLIQKLPEEKLLRLPMFWINSGVILFFSSTFVLSFMLDYFKIMLGNDLTGFWTFRNLLRFLFCTILTYAGWLDLRQVSYNQEKFVSK